jgi:hypothetical protein
LVISLESFADTSFAQLGEGRHPLQSHHQEITEEVRMDVSRTTPDELLLKSRDSVADGSLNLAL